MSPEDFGTAGAAHGGPEGIEEAVHRALLELSDIAGLRPGSLLVIGSSTSEIAGNRIGTAGSVEIGRAVVRGALRAREARQFLLAFQCCEHLNRALVVERETLLTLRLEEVAAVPVPGAGGATAASAYRAFSDPVLAEAVSADAGIDIGDTLIGMHLRAVAVPVRLSVRQVGQARVVAARTRPRLIGGERAKYRISESEESH